MKQKLRLLFTMLLLAVMGSAWADEVTLTNANIVSAGAGATGYQSWSIKDGNNKTWDAYVIKYQHSNATSSYHYLQIKKYASNTAYYIQVPEYGTKITSITMTVSSTSQPMTGGGNSATLYFSSSNTTSAGGTGVASGTGSSSVTIDCSSLNLNTGFITASGAVRIWDIRVVYENGSQTTTVATPIISPNGGNFSTPQENVTISCSTTGATIYYTTDGSDPKTSNTRIQYNSLNPISVAKTTTIKAYAEKDGVKSDVAENTYTLIVATPYINTNNAPEVSIYCNGTPDATIYYTTDGTEPATSDTRIQYIGTFTLTKTTTIKACAEYGDMERSETVEKVVTLKTANPTFSPTAGTYSSEQSVTISCENEGAIIYYTTDGSDPTTSSAVYSGAITVSQTTTIKAFAKYGEYDESEIVSVTYTIREISGDAFVKMTSIDELAEGIEVIIVNEEASKTMGEQQENNFYTVDVVFNVETAIPDEGATIMTLEKSGNYWCLKTSNGYLYAASSNKNYLKTESEIDENAKAAISFDDYGNATIQFQGDNTRNLLRYNPNTSGSPLFSCYGSGQKPVQIYYRVAGNVVAAPVISPASGTDLTESTQVTITSGEGTTIYYTTDGSSPVADGELTSSAKVYSGPLTFNKAVTVKAVAIDAEGTISRVAIASYNYVGSVNVPYYENFDTGLGMFTVESLGTSAPEWIFKTNDTDEDIAKYGEARKYAFVTGNGDKRGTSRLISPVIDLTEEDIESASLNFIHAGRYFDGYNSDNLTEEQTESGNAPTHAQLFVREEGGTWQQLTIPNWFTQSSNYTRRNSGEISLNNYVGKKVQISFLFTSDANSTGTWNVMKFAVTVTKEEETVNYETVNMKTDGYITYVVKNDIDWDATMKMNNNVYGYKVIQFTEAANGGTTVLVELGNDEEMAVDETKLEEALTTEQKKPLWSEKIIPAGTPIILKGKAGDNLLVIAKSDDVIPSVKGNLLKPSFGDVQGSSAQTLYVLQKSPEWVATNPYENYLFYKLANGRTIPERKAYLNGTDASDKIIYYLTNNPGADQPGPGGPGGAKANFVILAHAEAEDMVSEDAGLVDGINEVNGGNRMNDNEYYSISGVKVSNPSKGIYILNGKKVIVK